MGKNSARFAKPDDEVDALVPGGSGGASAPPRGWNWYGVGLSNLGGDSGMVAFNNTAPPNASLLFNNTDAGGVDRGAQLRALGAGTVITLTSGGASLVFTVVSSVSGGNGATADIRFNGTTADSGILALAPSDGSIELGVAFS